jgi:chemotaxis protein MotB
VRRQRRSKGEEHVSHDRWLVSYADFVTLLFAFFVVLYASSHVDKRKVSMLALSIQVAFQQLGVFDTSNSQIPLSDPEIVPFSKAQVVEDVGRTIDLSHFVGPVRGLHHVKPTTPPFDDFAAELRKALAPEIQRRIVDINLRREGLVVSLREVGFYESASASLRSSSKDAIDRLVGVLKTRAESLRVEGHTDNVPIHTSLFDSNWELSTARASEFVKILITRYQFPPTRLSAAGFAEFHPVASNQTAEGRASNRRVDIVILNPSIFGSSEPAQGAPSASSH